MNCADCGQPTGKKYGRYCDAHRWKHRGKPSTYRLTPEREAYLRAHYKPNERGTSYRCAAVLQVPKWRICRWAAELGLTGQSTKGPDWTPHEDAFLEQHIGSRLPGWIGKQLGRSVTAVVMRSKRLSISRRDAREWMTATQVAEGFGVDGKTVTRWIERGLLSARTFGEQRTDDRVCAWRISEGAVKRFITAHPMAFSLAKVEQVWFLSLICGGFTNEKAA